MAEDRELLAGFVRDQSQDAFTELVNRHLNLVYSAALRQVRSPQLAEEVSQSVFLNLSRNAARLASDTILTAWLYQVTRHAATDVVRREASRQAREQIAFQMSELSESSTNWKEIEPLLDEAMDALEPADRSALLLRYFDNKSLREVGEAIGASEDAAQKRVSRAIDRLREHFSKRKVSIGAGGLAALLSANAVQAAPVGLALTVATTAGVGLAAISSTSIITNTIALSMTATQKILVTTGLVGAIAFGVYEATQVSALRAEVQALSKQRDENAELSARLQVTEKDRDAARAQIATMASVNIKKTNEPNEALKLRGEVSTLRSEKKALGATSGLSKITANPEARKMMREQQKMAMSMLYKSLAKDLKLTDEQTGKLNDLMADYVMDNVEKVTEALRDKLTPDQMQQLFDGENASLDAKVRELVGEDGISKYQDYSKDLISLLSAEQFKGKMSGDDAAKAEKVKQFQAALRAESQALLAENGLPADYQLIPMMSFQNIASEADGERSLKLLEQLYTRAGNRMKGVFDEQELTKLQEFSTKAVENNRGALIMNRGLMAPIAD